MKVLLAGPDYEENLSIRYLSSSLLAAGHDTTLATFNSSVDTSAVANSAYRADIVGLSMCFQSRAQEFLRLAQLLKSRNPKQLIVAGGHCASCAAEPLLAHHPEIDIVVIHEGERTLVEIAEAMPQLEERLPQIFGIAYRGQEVHFTNPRRTADNLDTLPFPDRRGPIHLLAGVPTSYMMGSRGCYGSCAYCCITTLHQLAPGKRFRQRSVDEIAAEMADLYHDRGTRQFVFHDDNFLVPSEAFNHARLSKFEKALKARNIKKIALVIKCRPADANRIVLQRLKDLGLVRVFLGVESSTAAGLADLERTQNVDDSERALETCAALDISAQFTLMIFHPDATLDTLRSDVAFMRRFSGNPLNFCRAEIYVGTPLEKRMIALGRARGDYLARVYSLSDPVADLACKLSLDLFASRCWSNGSLMQSAIGLDHLASVTKRFYNRPSEVALCERVHGWVRSVNLDTISLLDEVIDFSASTHGNMGADIQGALQRFRERESRTRQQFLSEGSNLREELKALRLSQALGPHEVVRSRLRLARQAAVAVLAIGMPAISGCQSGVSEMAPPPLKGEQTPAQETRCSLVGDVTDPQGAVVANATITITNLDTNLTRTVRTNEVGHYVAGGLKVGRYTVKAESPGFSSVEKTGIVLEPGANGRADVALEIRADFKLDVIASPANDAGCCEYAATPLKVEQEDWATKKKPFNYIVGTAEDHGTFKGIAELVYDDPGMWVQIFEANRNVVAKHGAIPAGTSILIPPRKRIVPKLIAKVPPTYPRDARQKHVWGDVVLDVTLNDHGIVERVELIDGNPELAEAATAAVKQWQYQTLLAKGKPVVNFVVVVSFGKGGRVH
jgi:anaerobic magnesium-protoporphyrin IX monomethyl ester cyclase